MDEAQILTHNFQVMGVMLQSISVVMGVCFTLAGLFQLKKAGDKHLGGGQITAAGPLLMLVCGGIFMILPTFLGTFGLAIFQSKFDIGYDSSGGGLDSLIPPILMFVRLIGVGSFMRGVALIARSTGYHAQQGTLAKAITHMVAGILCVHITATLSIVENILGLN